jgi:anti-sigma B factor antagonist
MTDTSAAPEPLSLDVVREGELPVVLVRGDLDMATAGQLRDCVLTLFDEGERTIVIDLAGATFADSSGLNAIVWSAHRFEEEGGTVTLRAPSPSVARTLEVSGLDKVLRVEP